MVLYVVILFLCAGSSIPLAAMAWHRRPSRGARALFFFLLCIGWSCFAYAQNLMSPDLAGKQFWNHAEYLGGMFLTPLMLVLALVFTHREKWIRPIPMLLLFALPVFTLLANWTNSWHHLYYTATWIDASGPLPILAKTRGPLYAIKFFYAYAAAAFSLILLARSIRRADSATRPQLWLLLAAFLLPILLNTPYLFRLMPHKHVNLTLLGFAGSSALVSIAMFRYRLLSEALLEQQRLEQRNELLLNHANAILYTITPEGVFTYVSPNWTRLLGHPTDFVVGKNFSTFVLADDHPSCFEFLSRVVQTGHLQSGIEYRVRHKNGQLFWHTSSIMPVMDKQNQIVAYVGAAHDVTSFKQAQEELRDANRHLADHVASREQELRDAIADTLVAAESEARRIGEDIHSGLCQDLVGIARLAESVEVQPDKACLPCRQTLDLIREQSARLAGVARAYSHDLALPELDAPSFSDALETLARRTEQLFHAEVEINANLEPAPFDRAQSVHVFRIVREAISNAVQHAHARHIWIDLIQESTQLVLSISNDGQDLPSPERLSAGLGLKQIRMRARLLDATFSIARRPDGKTVAELAIPKAAQESP